MENNILDHDGYTREISREFFRSVYSYMFAALGITGLVAYYAGTPEFFMKYFIAGGDLSPLYYVVIFSPLALAWVIQGAYRRLSMPVLILLYILYSILIGLSLGSIFLVYSGQTIASTFVITAGAFAGMAILGYTTKTDLTKMGSLLYMAFIGIFIASIVNIWTQSNTLEWIISIVGVFVFTGLTAYYMQTLKNVSQDSSLSGVDREKLSLVGGLILYITFVNLFLSLLRLVGSRD